MANQFFAGALAAPSPTWIIIASQSILGYNLEPDFIVNLQYEPINQP